MYIHEKQALIRGASNNFILRKIIMKNGAVVKFSKRWKMKVPQSPKKKALKERKEGLVQNKEPPDIVPQRV